MIVVLTAPRPSGISYLAATLRDIDASARSETRIVVYDDSGPAPELPAGWRAEAFHRPVRWKNNKWATWRAFDLAAERGEDLLLFEDDVHMVKNAAALIEQLPVPDDVAFLLFYAPCGDRRMQGIWRAHTANYNFAQCLKLPLRTCQRLSAMRMQMECCRLGGSDETIRTITAPLDWHFGVVFPGLVQHVGADSAVGNAGLTGQRISTCYAGDDFDATAILQSPLSALYR